MKYTKSGKVFECCGQYLATTKATDKSKLYCPRCGEELKIPIVKPSIVVVTK